MEEDEYHHGFSTQTDLSRMNTVSGFGNSRKLAKINAYADQIPNGTYRVSPLNSPVNASHMPGSYGPPLAAKKKNILAPKQINRKRITAPEWDKWRTWDNEQKRDWELKFNQGINPHHERQFYEDLPNTEKADYIISCGLPAWLESVARAPSQINPKSTASSKTPSSFSQQSQQKQARQALEKLGQTLEENGKDGGCCVGCNIM